MRRQFLFVTPLALAALLAIAALTRPAASESTAIPARSAAASPVAVTTLTTDTIIIPTYPYAAHLYTATNTTYNMPYQWLHWGEYGGANPQPVDQPYTRLTLENAWLRVSVLPQLGGRVYELIDKTTGNNELYRNPVIKPTNWGPPEQGWWLAAGGLEWGLPVEEHGYESASPWTYTLAESSAGITITVRDSLQPDRLRAAVSIFLPADRAVLIIRPRIENDRSVALDFKWWDNAMLAPGPGNSVGTYYTNPDNIDLKFVFPETQVTVHSTGDLSLPGEGQAMSWPIYKAIDRSRLQNWKQWLGFFARPAASADWVGVIDRTHQEGLVRVFPHQMATGSKGFAMGWRNPIGAEQWTNDGSYYAELHGGLAPTFWDSVSIGAHQAIEWEETWYPLTGLSDITTANAEAALLITPGQAAVNVQLYATRPHLKPHLTVWQRSTCQIVTDVEIGTIDPAAAQTFEIATPLSPADLTLLFYTGDTLLIGYNETDCVPPSAHVNQLPPVTTSATFTVTWAGSDLYSGIAAYDVQFKDGLSGRWTDWLTNTTTLSAAFGGEHGHTYFFRARARDLQGNTGVFQGDDEGDAFTSVLLTPAPVLEFSYKTAPNSVSVGQPISYHLVVKNNGNLTGAITLTDTLPLSLTVISGTLTAQSGSIGFDGEHILWSGVITPETGVGLQYALTPTQPIALMQPLTNTVHIAGGVVPVTRTATTMFALLTHLPLLTR